MWWVYILLSYEWSNILKNLSAWIHGHLYSDRGSTKYHFLLSFQGEWQAFSGNSLEQRDIIFTAKVISASSSRKEVHVFIPPRSTFEDPKPSYRLIGSTFRRACTIIKGNSIVVQVICGLARFFSLGNALARFDNDLCWGVFFFFWQ